MKKCEKLCKQIGELKNMCNLSAVKVHKLVNDLLTPRRQKFEVEKSILI